MNEKKWTYVLAYYLREQKTGLLLLLISDLCFLVVGYLYQLETEMLVYALCLSLVLCLIVYVPSYLRYLYAHRKRRRIAGGISHEWSYLPEATSLTEEDYQQMVSELGERCANLATEWEMERKDSLDYYSTWVHQIKTPIAVMRLQLQASDTVEHRELLAELFRIEQYVDMVLSFIRLGSESNDLVFRQTELDGVIRGVIRKFAPQFIRKRIHLQYDGIGMTLVTDEKWFSFILEQAVSNAVKYTGQGGDVSIYLVEDQRQLVVEDHGIGIAAEDLPRVFEKGYTGYNGREDKKATGLGLYLCKQAADKLGLNLRISSVSGVGTKFIIEIEETLEK